MDNKASPPTLRSPLRSIGNISQLTSQEQTVGDDIHHVSGSDLADQGQESTPVEYVTDSETPQLQTAERVLLRPFPRITRDDIDEAQRVRSRSLEARFLTQLDTIAEIPRESISRFRIRHSRSRSLDMGQNLPRITLSSLSGKPIGHQTVVNQQSENTDQESSSSKSKELPQRPLELRNGMLQTSSQASSPATPQSSSRRSSKESIRKGKQPMQESSTRTLSSSDMTRNDIDAATQYHIPLPSSELRERLDSRPSPEILSYRRRSSSISGLTNFTLGNSRHGRDTRRDSVHDDVTMASSDVLPLQERTLQRSSDRPPPEETVSSRSPNHLPLEEGTSTRPYSFELLETGSNLLREPAMSLPQTHSDARDHSDQEPKRSRWKRV